MLVTFSAQEGNGLRTNIRWANLEGMPIRSTSEALDSIYAQLRRNSLLSKQLANAYYNPFPDTLLSCEPQLHQLQATGGFRSFFINDKSILDPLVAPPPDRWFQTAPSCYASRPKIAGDDIDQMACEGEWCATLDQKPHHEVCSATRPECRAYIDEDAMSTRVAANFYWNLHVFPSIVFHPRHHTNGRIMTEIVLTQAEAEAKRLGAANNPGKEDLKPYISPVMDDSMSVYFSGQFSAPQLPSETWVLSLDIPAAAPGATSFYHDPAIIFRIPRMPTVGDLDRASFSETTHALQAALLRPFAKSLKDDQFLTAVDVKCPFWKLHDDDLGKKAFDIRTDIEAELPDVIPTDPHDIAWKTTVEEGARTYLRDARTLKNQMAIVRKKEFVYSDYWWKGCPQAERSPLALTKKQMLDLITEPVPTCNLLELRDAVTRVYNPIYEILRTDGDVNEAGLALRRAEEAEYHVMGPGAAIFKYDYTNCPESIVTRFVR